MSYARFVKKDEGNTITFMHDGETYSVSESHPKFEEVFHLIFGAGEDFAAAVELVNVKSGVEREFARVSERVSIADDKVYFDNVEVHGELIDQIIEYFNDGEPFEPLVSFMEKLYVNSNSHSIDQLFRWISDRNLAITEDGNFIAYKGVNQDEKTGQFQSVHRGKAVVDGKSVNGAVPNNIGSVVEMARDEVTFDPGVHCSVGLHAGTWEYASNWAPWVLTVEINPRDVVSVPDDCESQKLRVCRYRVTGITEGPLNKRVVESYDSVVDTDDDWFDSVDDNYCEPEPEVLADTACNIDGCWCST